MRLPLLTLILASGASAQALELASPFQDHMVLQHTTTVPVWGRAGANQSIAIRASWSEETFRGNGDAEGRFRVNLPTPAPSRGHTLEIESPTANVILQDVAIGEVWLCSGQSNMEWRMAQIGDDVSDATFPDLRYFEVPNEIALTPRERCGGQWVSATPERVRTWSAVAYYFGRRLHEALDVPIGLLDADWGGTVIEAWTRAEALRELGDFDAELDRIAAWSADPATLERKEEERRRAWWKRLGEFDEGSRDERFASDDLDVSEWDELRVPGPWTAELASFDGIVWLRRTFAVDSLEGVTRARLELGPIDDMDTVWVNGTRVGGLEEPGRWQEPRRYALEPSTLREGSNTIAVRVLDTGGGGGTADANAKVRLVLATKEGERTIDLAGSWRARVGAAMKALPAFPARSTNFHANTPTALWNGMVAPLVPYAIRGAIWYQGESNRSRAHQYRRLLPTMIEDWRARFERKDFPFYFVQIAPYAYGGDRGEAAELREAQFLTLSALPNTGMAVTMDIGNPRDIHPRNKRDVSERLARWALFQTYGRKDVVPSGPLYRAMTIEGNAIRLHFDHVDGGLRPLDRPLTHFTIAGEDRVFHEADARIDGDSIVVRSEGVPTPKAVRFAWGAADEPNLRNAEGLPASSFRTDRWPGVTEAH